MPDEVDGCCEEFQCQIPPFRCNCQQDCYYFSRHQDPMLAIDPDTYYTNCVEVGDFMGHGPCDPLISRVPNIAPLNISLRFLGGSAFPSGPGYFDSINLPQSILDCQTDCDGPTGDSTMACDATWVTCDDNCEAFCAGAGDPAACLLSCHHTCLSAQAGCYEVAFLAANTCYRECIAPATKAELARTFGEFTDCQHGESIAQPEDGLAFAQCLRHTAHDYIDAAWVVVNDYADALSGCVGASGPCYADLMSGDTTEDCRQTEYHCDEHAYAAFLRAVEGFTEQWSMERAGCIRDWLSASGLVPEQLQPLKKLPSCEWQWLWKRKQADLVFNARKTLCEADLWDCDSGCDIMDSAISPGVASCAAICNIAASECMYEAVRRAWVDDRMEPCRKMWNRLPPHGSNQTGEWCRAQCDVLDTQCTELYNTAQGSCYYVCCGVGDVPGCMADCDAAIEEPGGVSTMCATNLSNCLGYDDVDGERVGCRLGDQNCQDGCWNTYQSCIFTSSGDWVMCFREGRTHDYAAVGDPPELHNYCKEIGCARLRPDCPSCLASTPDDYMLGLGQEELEVGRYWALLPAAPTVILTGCD